MSSAPASPDLMRIALPERIDPRVVTVGGGGRVVALSGQTMGTVWRVLADVDGHDERALRDAVTARLDAIVASMSHWLGSSELCRFNRATAGSWMQLSPDFAAVVAAALTIAEASEGAFSPALGHLVDLWGFGPPGPVSGPPDATAVARARLVSDWRLLAFDREAGRLRQPGGLALDLSGIAKGYAVDAVSEVLARAGVTDALVEVGGELRGCGFDRRSVRGPMPWWVDLEAPASLAVAPMRVALHGLSVATSGSYVRGGHNLDWHTGHPARHGVVACSVMHPSAMMADAWASALGVMGGQAGLAMARAHDLPVRWVLDDGKELISPALARMIAQ